MPLWLLNLIPSSAAVYAGLAAAVLGLLAYTHHAGYVSGQKSYQVKQEIAQKKHNMKVAKDYAKIDKATPTGSRAIAGKWLLQYTSTGH